MTAAQVVVAALALYGTWDLTRRLLNWSDPDEPDDSTVRWQQRRRALTDVTRGHHHPVDPCDGGNQPHHPGGPEWD